MWTEEVIEVGGVRLNVATGPATGPPLLLLHGVTRCWQDFSPVLAGLGCRRQPVGLDFRGHGRSDRRPGGYRVIDYAGDVTALVRARWRDPVVIYGHSLGGLVALAVAAALPDRVRALVLEDPPAAGLVRDIRGTPLFALFGGLRALAGPGRSVPETARLLGEVLIPAADGRSAVALGRLRDATSLRFSARCLQELDPGVLDTLLEGRWLDGYDEGQVVGGVRCPVLLLCADEAYGGVLPARESAALAGRLADCTLIDLPGVGHLIHWLEVEKTTRYVLGFLESL